MNTPNEQFTTLNSTPYHYLGVTDYVQLEMEARRMRARAVAALLQRGWTALMDSFRRQAAEAELRALDDRTLHDMGLNRTSIPAADVDVIYSNQLMEHLHPEDAAEQLDNIFRALRPGGTYVCITPNRVNGPHDVSKHFDRIASGFHLHEYTYRELARLLRAAGFTRLEAVLDWRGRRARVPIWFAGAIERLAAAFPALARTHPMGRLLPVRIAATKKAA